MAVNGKLTAMCFCIQAESKTPKQRLLGWIQHKVPDLPITNFSQDWRDGKVLGALVDSCAPGTPCCSRLCRKFTVTNFISKNLLHCIVRWHFWVKLELFGMQQACKSGFLTAWVCFLWSLTTLVFLLTLCVKSKWKPGSMFMYEIPKNAKLKTSEL